MTNHVLTIEIPSTLLTDKVVKNFKIFSPNYFVYW